MFYIGPVLGVITTITAVVGFVYFLSMQAAAKREATRVLSVGHRAAGQVVAARETGFRVNNQPQIQLCIVVTPYGGVPYQVQMTKIVSILEISRYQVGAHLDLRVDPANPRNIAVAGPLHSIGAQNPGFQGR